MSKSGSLAVKQENNVALWRGVLRGSLFAVAVSLIAILVFAFIIKLTGIGDGMINPVNQAIKGISVLMGCFYALKEAPNSGLLKGILIGLMYVAISFIVFSLLNGQMSFTKTIINDMLFGAIIGAICGVIAINFRG